MPRRKAGSILPLEAAILQHAVSHDSFYGFALAKSLSDGGSALTAHGTLYKALGRMTEAGLLTAEWEADPPADESRPRRRIYRVTGEGARALSAARATPLASAKVSLA